MKKKYKTIKAFLSFFILAIAIIGTIPFSNNVYADNTTDITFEVTGAEQDDDSEYEDIAGDSILFWEAGQDWVLGHSTKSIVTFYLPREKFTGISLDDHELTEGKEYSVSGNYTTITFKRDYLDSLAEGQHEIIARFNGLDEEDEESLFSTYLTVYTEESAEEAGIIVPNTGFFAAVEEIATSSLPVITFLGIAALSIFAFFKLRDPIQRGFSKIYKRLSSTTRILFQRPAKRYLPIVSDKLKNIKPSNRSLKMLAIILGVFTLTGGLGTLFHHLSYLQSDAVSTINLEVNTSADIRGTLQYVESIAKTTDTVRVDTESGVEYDIYMSAGDDNHLHADGTDDSFGENTNLVSLSDGSWGFTTEKNDSIFTSVPKKGEEVLVTHMSEPGETKVYFVAKGGVGFAAGLYRGTTRYTIVAKSGNPVSITPNSSGESTTLTITTPIAKNGDMAIETPEVKIGEDECLSPSMQSADNQYITITCNVPDDLTPGEYRVSIDFSDIEQELSVEDGYTEPEPTPEPGPGPDPTPGPEPDPNPDPEPDPGPAPDPEPDPDPDPEVTYYTVTSGPSNSTYGSTNRTSTSVAAGTTFTTDGNKLTFSDGRTITATPKSVTGYMTSCSGWTPSSGTVDSDMSVTATCTGTIIQYKVTVNVNNTSYGTANASEIWIPYNTTYTSSGNTMTFSNGRTIKATPITATGYTTTCNSWNPSSGTITGNITVTANCTRSINNYTMTFRVNDSSSGSVTRSSASVPYDTTYVSNGNTLTFTNGTTVTANPTSITGYDVTCSGWSPSRGKVSANTTFTATCTKKAKKGTVTYVSPEGYSKSYTGTNHTIKSLAFFAGPRYSNIYDLNSTDYKRWTKKEYYFDYWEGSDGNKYAPAAVDDGHDPYNDCTTCKSTYNTSSGGLVLTPHYTKMNNLNLAAITLAWPDGYTDSDTMVASNKPEGWSHYVTPSSPHNKKMERYRVASTPELRTQAREYYTQTNRDNAVEASNLKGKCDHYQSYGCSTSWYSEDIGYFYARSCDRTAAIAIYYGIKGKGDVDIKIPFGLPAQARYFARGDQPWKAVNTKNNSKTSSSSTGTADNMGRYETHYQPGDIRLVYRTSSSHENYKLKYEGNTYYLGHIAMYVKTEDGLSHIAEGGHATYLVNDKKYNENGGVFKFAHTAYTNGGSFDHLSPFYYRTKAQGDKKNEWYAIWRYTGNGN